MRDPVLLQRNYYRTTADQYDRMHNSAADCMLRVRVRVS